MDRFSVALVLGWTVGGVAQSPVAARPPVQGTLVDGHAAYPVPPATVEGVLKDMSGRAAVIFTGTVAAVREPAAASEPSAGVVEIEFAVEQGVRGAVSGTTYVVREWAGLWRDGPRFRVGQRRLMLLHAPGPGGSSSPVDGLDGAIPVTGGAAVLRPMVAGVAPVAGCTSCVDLRWLEAKTLRGAPVAESAWRGVRPDVGAGVARLTAWEAGRRVAR